MKSTTRPPGKSLDLNVLEEETKKEENVYSYRTVTCTYMFLPDSDWDTKVRKTSWKKGGLHTAFEREWGRWGKQVAKNVIVHFRETP